MKIDMQSELAKLQSSDNLKLVLTPKDVAVLLGVSRNTAYETVHSKGFPSFKVGKQYRVRLDRLLQWMEEVEENAKEAA